ncbi:MAG: TM2 domain-containing protein [Spirochaetaceae bacterium]|jgi:TM2 domain-containing membrane protein YozV/predicted transcriptional regulator|nr:TM2 domain-containing protein [Spirochaetaceae bacterium]
MVFSTGLAYLLWLISGCGLLGFHRFYLGKWRTGILWAFTCGLCGVGAIYDFFTLPRQVREANIRKAVENQMYTEDFHRINGSFRYAQDGIAQPVREKDSVERTILKVAKEQSGIVSPTEVALRANIPVEEAKKHLDGMVNKGFAELRVRQSGQLAYTIPEMMDPNSPLENF